MESHAEERARIAEIAQMNEAKAAAKEKAKHFEENRKKLGKTMPGNYPFSSFSFSFLFFLLFFLSPFFLSPPFLLLFFLLLFSLSPFPPTFLLLLFFLLLFSLFLLAPFSSCVPIFALSLYVCHDYLFFSPFSSLLFLLLAGMG